MGDGYLLPERNDVGFCCVCVPVPQEERHKQAFLAQIFALSRWWTWQRDAQKRGKDAAEVWKKVYECVMENMENCCCGSKKEPLLAFNNEGQLIASYDGGVTWQLAPELDPRLTSVIAPHLPGNDGNEKRCNAAWATEAVVRDDIVQKLKDANLGIEMVSLIAGALAIYLSAGTLAPLIVSLVGSAMAVGSAAVDAAFTNSVWEQFRCILYCNMRDDASFSSSDVQQIKAEISTRIGGLAGELLIGTVDAFGRIGLTNAARSKRATGSGCEDCYCDQTWCYEWNFTVGGSGEWAKVTELGHNFGVYTAGQGWTHTDSVVTYGDPDAAYRAVFIKRETSVVANFTRIEVEYEIVKGTYSVPSSRGIYISEGGISTFENHLAAQNFNTMTNGTHTFVWTGSINTSRINVFLRSSQDNTIPYSYSGSCRILRVKAQGSGTNPFGDNNC